MVPETDPVVIENVKSYVWLGVTEDDVPIRADAMWYSDAVEIESAPVSHFRLPGVKSKTRGRNSPVLNKVLTWPILQQALRDQRPDALAHEYMDTRIRFFDQGENELGACEVSRLVSAEVPIGEQAYWLSDGEVIRVAADFLASMDEELGQWLIEYDEMPPYDRRGEGPYNDQVGNAGLRLDKRLIHLEGQSPIEPADLWLPGNRLVHVKRNYTPSKMAHVWVQLHAGAQVLRRRADARNALKERIRTAADGDTGREAAAEETIDLIGTDPSRVTFAVGLLDVDRDRGLSSLPLYTRIAALRALQGIADLSYRPALVLVPPA